MPHTSPTGVALNSSSNSSACSEHTLQTPAKRAGYEPGLRSAVFAMQLASLASVFVGPKPTQVGRPIQRMMCSRRQCPSATGSPKARSVPAKSRKVSSML